MSILNYSRLLYSIIKRFPFWTICFLIASTWCKGQSSSPNMIILKGEEFPTEKKTPLFCDTVVSCWTVHDGIKRTVFIQLIGILDNKKTMLQIEVPAKPGTCHIKLDADGDPKYGEKFYFEIAGKNPPVDNLVYTPEDPMDEAIVHIDSFDEESGQLIGNYSAKIFNGATAVKRAAISGTFSLSKK